MPRSRKLRLRRETLHGLTQGQLAQAAGASGGGTCAPRLCAVLLTDNCPSWLDDTCVVTYGLTCDC